MLYYITDRRMEEFEELNYRNIYILAVIIAFIMVAVSFIAYEYENKDVPKGIYYLICADERRIIINLSVPEQYGCYMTQRFEYGRYIDATDYGNDYQYDIPNGLFNIS